MTDDEISRLVVTHLDKSLWLVQTFWRDETGLSRFAGAHCRSRDQVAARLAVWL